MLRAVMRYRPARPARSWWNVLKTLLFLALFWFVFLLVLPIAVSVVEVELGIQRFPPQPLLASIGLVAFTALGLWAAVTLAITGGGTPAPFDTARTFVVGGPYAYVRNPLVIAAIGQGVAIGLTLGSVPVLVYFATSLIVWYFLIRPDEEHDLAQRFGESWRAYTRQVRAFRPRLTPYRAG
ncbi:MAG: methyltransferase family protein [Vicinamibacterales bacterium]